MVLESSMSHISEPTTWKSNVHIIPMARRPESQERKEVYAVERYCVMFSLRGSRYRCLCLAIIPEAPFTLDSPCPEHI